LIECRAVLVEYGAVLEEYIAVLVEYRALLIHMTPQEETEYRVAKTHRIP